MLKEREQIQDEKDKAPSHFLDQAALALDVCLQLRAVAHCRNDDERSVAIEGLTAVHKLIEVGSIDDHRLKFVWRDCCKAINEIQRNGACSGGTPLADSLVERARAANDEAEREHKSVAHCQWREWPRDNWSAGTKQLYDFTKIPTQLLPDNISTDEIQSHDAVGRIDFEYGKYKKLWNAIERTSTTPDDEDAELEDAASDRTAEMLRTASLVFTHSSSSTYDGIHPRHFVLLSEEALEVLASISNTCERMEEWPDSVLAVTVALIPKARGGTRPICLFSAAQAVD